MVICGILYGGILIEFKGCLNDVKCMSYLLMLKFYFLEFVIFVLIGIKFFWFIFFSLLYGIRLYG